MSHDHTYVSGEVLTAANLNDLSSARVAYTAVTADQTGITTAAVDLTSLTVTFTAIASRYYRITGSVGYWTITAGAPTYVNFYITNGSNTLLNQALPTAGGATFIGTGRVEYIVAPGAGSVTYKLRALTATGTVTMSAAATLIASILVEDLGSS